jgi:hypothetical protein
MRRLLDPGQLPGKNDYKTLAITAYCFEQGIKNFGNL